MAKSKADNPLIPIGIRVPKSILKKIDNEANKHDKSRTDFLIALIEDYFKDQEAA